MDEGWHLHNNNFYLIPLISTPEVLEHLIKNVNFWFWLMGDDGLGIGGGGGVGVVSKKDYFIFFIHIHM